MAVWSEVNNSALSTTYRFDAEFYKPEYLAYERLTSNGDPIVDLVQSVIHPTEITRIYVDNGIRILLAQNIRRNRLEFAHAAYMSDHAKALLSHNRLLPGDVVMTRSGANFGDTASFFGMEEEIYACADCLIIRPNSILSGYLSTYFNTKIGRGLIDRGAYGAAQPHIAPSYIKEIRVPRIGSIENEVHECVQMAKVRADESVQMFAEAEEFLATSLGLVKFDLSPTLYYERNFTETQQAARIDAEFFQTKYGRLLQLINNTGLAIRLGDYLCEPARRGLQPLYESKGTFTVINSQHVGSRYIELDGTRLTTTSLAERNNGKSILKKYDVLLNSTGYQTIGRAQTLLDDLAGVVDSHVTILRPKLPLDPVYLGFFLNAIPGFLQTERHWTGSSGQIELRLEPIENFTIWLAPEEIQKSIRKKVEASHAARNESHRLLKEAKRMVEDAVDGVD